MLPARVHASARWSWGFLSSPMNNSNQGQCMKWKKNCYCIKVLFSPTLLSFCFCSTDGHFFPTTFRYAVVNDVHYVRYWKTRIQQISFSSNYSDTFFFHSRKISIFKNAKKIIEKNGILHIVTCIVHLLTKNICKAQTIWAFIVCIWKHRIAYS